MINLLHSQVSCEVDESMLEDELADKPGKTIRNEVLRIARYPNPVSD